MEELRRQELKKERHTSVYVIDGDFKIIYSNDGEDDILLQNWKGQLCYKFINNKEKQCRLCPMRAENNGKSVVFNKQRQEWVSVSSHEIEIAELGACTVITCESLEEENHDIFQNLVGKYDYDEMLVLNYLNNSYSVVYSSDIEEKSGRNNGAISTMVMKIVEKNIHPEDRKKMYDFWLLDEVGNEGVPEKLLSARYLEFRRQKADGTYAWTQQLLVPIRKNTNNDVFVMNFYNSIDTPEKESTELEDKRNTEFGNGLFNRKDFFKAVENIMERSSEQTNWCIVSIDIENLKLFNEWYGREEGNKLIASIAESLRKLKRRQLLVAGYFGNDDFSVMLEYNEERIKQLYDSIVELMKEGHEKMGFMPSVGIYKIKDKKMPAFQMYDYAEFARTSIKGNYGERIKVFNSKMVEELESKYVLLSDIQRALKETEFTFFLQPKCNIQNGKIVGAEALVRWHSKEKGLISPGIFVPFLENSGLIAELDTYIWEEVCKWQKMMLRKGVKTVPISINISKVDMYSMDVPMYLKNLIKKYDVDPKYIELEITESVFMEQQEFIQDIINQLRKEGFKILLDDFGSGYSSLNMLKDIEVDVLKMDMRFLEINKKNSTKGIGILETVQNMARLMGIETIAEGVESEREKKFLLEMGYSYAQGYYFYRPMPKEGFEELLLNGNKIDKEGSKDLRIERLVLKDLLNESMFSEMMLNNMLGAVAFYEVFENKITLKRYNMQYAALVGVKEEYREETLNILSHLSEKESKKLFRMFEEAHEKRNEGAECDVNRRIEGGKEIWLNLSAFFLSEQNGHRIFYSSLRDITEIYRKNEQLREQNEMLHSLNTDMPGGYYRHKKKWDCEILYISNRFLEIVGFTKEEIQEQFQGKMIQMIHPEDRKLMFRKITLMNQKGGDGSSVYRILSKNGYIKISDHSRIVKYNGYEFIQGIILPDTSFCNEIELKKEALQ